MAVKLGGGRVDRREYSQAPVSPVQIAPAQQAFSWPVCFGAGNPCQVTYVNHILIRMLVRVGLH